MRRLALTLAATVAVIGLSACGKSGESSSGETATAPAPAAAPEPTDAEKQALLAALPAPYNSGDLTNGKKVFAICKSCHTLVPGGANMTGPNLHGMFGRKPGTAEGYKYSDVVKAATFTWDAEHLDQWLTSPKTFMPGTKMTFMGVKDAKDRTDLIAYLKVETGYAPQ
ncbi:cytochrome c family protein [Phenylobacterium sp.]|uniref:c-type cytochrome n=1 Tax=Phenylobacterium sp. TaxID=1871053 RepID=UPI002722290B|nr:cytochrome c family protein [Phenylobacterium sp.]MDO8802457.1 cytochrome c family protein [Phenylobacterium sp.]